MARTGGNSQDRRRARRAAGRYSQRKEQRAPVSATEMQDFEALVATAHADEQPDLDPADDFAALAAEARGPEPTSTPEALALERLDAFVGRPALIAAAGDVSWGPEDGFLDLIADVNELLYDAPGYCRVLDVGVKLDKVLVYDGGDAYWSAPISIDGNGEPVLADRDQWTPVEQGWIEVPPGEDDDEPDFGEAESAGDMTSAEFSRDAGTSAGRLRFALRDVMLADGALEVDLPDAMQPSERLPERRADIAAPEAEPTPGGPIAWQSKFVPEATLTDDGRAFAPESLSWRELPLSLMAMIETSAQGGHDGAMLSGRIDRIWREGNDIMAEGVFDEGEFGLDIARMVGDGTLRGLSVDIAIHEYEVGPQSDYFNEDGSWREDAPVGQEDDRTPADLLFGEKSDERQIFVVTKGVIGMATVCPFPAFAEASISLIASGAGLRYTHQAGFIAVRRPSLVAAATEPTDEVESEVALEEEPAEVGLTAAAAGHAPVKPPAEWFENPGLEELTPLTITEDGRVYGHAWAWESCHLAFADACVTAPHSETENAYFHLGEIECEGGERLTVGKVTIDAPHAGQRLSRADATAHYDHTGSVAAHVRCGEDEHGGWFAGAIQPDLPDETLRLLRGSVLSGDWRTVNGNLELVALLAVNVPGFPVPRVRALVASGEEGQEVLSLTAAGVVLERTDEEEIADIAALADEARA